MPVTIDLDIPNGDLRLEAVLRMPEAPAWAVVVICHPHPQRTGDMDNNVVMVAARAALDALFDHGRPRRIQFCALIDRGHRELPIEASFVGRTIQTQPDDIIEVKLQESDGADKVLLLERTSGSQ